MYCYLVVLLASRFGCVSIHPSIHPSLFAEKFAHNTSQGYTIVGYTIEYLILDQL